MLRLTATMLALAAALSTPVFAAPARPVAPAVAADPTAADADAFVSRAEKELKDLTVFGGQAQWINQTYITDDTDAVAARVGAEVTEAQVRFAVGAARFDKVAGLSPDTRRKLDLLKLGVVLPAPSTIPGAAQESATLVTRMSSIYGKGRAMDKGQPVSGSDVEARMGGSRDPAELQEMWSSWHDSVGTPMRSDYARMVEITNSGAKELGFADAGAMWRAGYDMPPADFAKLVDRLWGQVSPLYEQLHCYVRAKLSAKYGAAVQKPTGPIRSDLTGNMWAQDWSRIYDIVAPAGAGDIGYDTGDLLKAKGYDALKMVRRGEGFYSSLGFAPLPDSFWLRSLFVKPADREVICHASAWDVDTKDDLRIKMCIKVAAVDFQTIHHELGHNYYQRAYNTQPFLYQNGANDGFHEAIGDFVALSITPGYLVKIGLLDPAKVPPADKDIGLLLRQALEKVPGLPWTVMVDKWRWAVFAGQIKPAEYQAGWDALRLQYQGVEPPLDRPATAFDPGAKYHIAASVPYARYFLARILQFQFYQAACKQAGWTGPLHRCSIYDDKEVGQRLNAMLSLGQSKPWPEALKAFTGSPEMDGGAIVAYFAPLLDWLKTQNEGRQCGW